VIEVAPEPRPLRELVSDLAAQTGVLIRQEIKLAKAEVGEKAKLAAKDVALMASGALAIVLGSAVLIAAIVLIVALALPLWAAALIVGLVFAGAGAGLAFAGYRSLERLDFVPRQTVETLKENRAWVSLELAK